MNGSKITAIEYYLPKKKENNKTLKRFNPKLDINRIKEKTGINNRYISAEKETVIDLLCVNHYVLNLWYTMLQFFLFVVSVNFF